MEKDVESINTNINNILGFDNPWPLDDVLKQLLWATEYLLKQYNYDGHKHEELNHCVKRGYEIINDIKLIE